MSPDAAVIDPPPMSVNAFAGHVGVDEKAVRKGIRNGRLTQSIGRNTQGHPVILDVALAEQEWERNRDTTKVRGPDFATIADHRKRLVQAQTRKIQQAYREKARQLVPARAIEIRFSTRVVTARTKLLGLPSRMKQRCPHLTAADLQVLDELIREALEELADDAHPPR